MHFFIPAARGISFVLALLVAASTVSALPRTVGVVAMDGKYFPRHNWCNPNTSWPRIETATLNHNENSMLKRHGAENTMLKRQENTMLKRHGEENTMLKRYGEENTMLKCHGQENTML